MMSAEQLGLRTIDSCDVADRHVVSDTLARVMADRLARLRLAAVPKGDDDKDAAFDDDKDAAFDEGQLEDDRSAAQAALSSHAPILVATDLSEGSDDAIREGHVRAAAVNAPLVIVHALPASEPEAAPVFEQLLTRVHALTGRDRDSVEIVLGDAAPADLIIETAERKNAALIVIGPGKARLSIGSTAGKVIRSATSAVLVARPPVASHVVVAGTDFSDGSYPALQTGADEAERLGGQLVAMHVVPVETVMESDIMGLGVVAMRPPVMEDLRAAGEQRLVTALADRRIDAKVSVVSGQPGSEIVAVAAALPAALIVVGTHGRTGWRRFFVGSVAEEVARTAPCSVLVERLSVN